MRESSEIIDQGATEAPLDSFASSMLALHKTHAQQNSPAPASKAEMYRQIALLLEALRKAIEAGRLNPVMPTANPSEEIQHGLARMDERLEAAVECWRKDRLSGQEEARLDREAQTLQAQLEVNRLLRVMWLATGMAAVGAGTALFLLEN